MRATAYANTETFKNFRGALDEEGFATAELNVKPITCGFTGNISFAFTLMKPFDAVSNAVNVTVAVP